MREPDDRIIDGRDIRPLLRGEAGACSPHEAFFYYSTNNIEAVRSGKWKLHIRKGKAETLELYDLEVDIGESANVAADHPEIVAALQEKIQAARLDLGDEAAGAEGSNCRPIGRVPDPRPLTRYHPEHPYMVAEYDGGAG